MKLKLTILILLTSLCAQAQNQTFTTAQYRGDFDLFWKSIDEDYCYFNKKQTNWAKVKDIYSPRVDTISSRAAFVSVLEDALYEIYDHHAGLNTNNMNSRRLVPSGTDIWAEYVNGKPTIIQTRSGYGAEKAGIAAGMEVIAIDGMPVDKAMANYVGKSLKTQDNEAKCFALRLALAGDHLHPRKITLKQNGQVKDYFPDANGMQLDNIRFATRIESKITNGIGYIKINDCLWNNDLIGDFDSVMQLMNTTKSLIIDLRETPSGGNTTVARAILGWFTSKEQFYQKHELYAEEKQTGIKRSWVEIVSPRPGKYYSKPLVILADHFTGSIAEGITIGFSATTKAKIIGTPLARLCGATYPYELPNTHIHYSFPVERLYHVNGTPREEFVPDIVIDYTKIPVADRDVALDTAMDVLQQNTKPIHMLYQD